MKFEGTAEHVATPDPTVAVNAAITREPPPLVRGEPGSGRAGRGRRIAAGASLPPRDERGVRLPARRALIARGRRT